MRVLFVGLLLCLSSMSFAAAQESPSLTYAYTYHQPTGNRFVTGRGTFPAIQNTDKTLADTPVWVVGVQLAYETAWVVVGANGTISGQTFDDRDKYGFSLAPQAFHAGLPPLVTADTVYQIYAFDSMGVAGSDLTHAVMLNGNLSSPDLIYIDIAGDVIRLIDSLSERERFPLKALPDARLVVNEAGQIAVYVDATDQRYVHGALGDKLEAASLAVLKVEDDKLKVVTKIELPESDVFEGISPFWADIDGDGADDLVVTVSNAAVGAQIRVYRADGSLMATGPAVGQGYRWRHQLAFGPFGPNGENELVNVLTPHIGGVVEFYQLRGDQLEIVASQPGYTSHVLGTRNLDMAVGGDFNGDGQPEIVLPTQDRQFIAGLQRTGHGAHEVWRLPLEGTLSTNLAAVTLPDNTLALAAGTADGRLRIWLPTD